MKFQNFYPLVAVAFILMPLGLSAQIKEDELPPIHVAFRTFMLQGAIEGERLHVEDGDGKRILLAIYNTNISHETYEYRGPNPIVFYQGDRPVAQLIVPEEMREFILFFVEGKSDQADQPRYEVYPMEADEASFPLGSYLFMNFSGLHVAALIDGQRILLEPDNKPRLVHLGHNESKGIAARFAELRDEGWVRSYQLAWYFLPNARRMVFLTRDNDVDRSLRIRTVTDRNFQPLPPDEEEAALVQAPRP